MPYRPIPGEWYILKSRKGLEINVLLSVYLQDHTMRQFVAVALFAVAPVPVFGKSFVHYIIPVIDHNNYTSNHVTGTIMMTNTFPGL